MNGLQLEIAEMICTDGPISLERFMQLALTHPLHGYYRRGQPIGTKGDFITAPEVHQMFGELIGLWVADTWERMGRPMPLRLVELGPGRGTLLADALRAARIVPGFLGSLDVHLVEVSASLRQLQLEALTSAGVALSWHQSWAEVPDGPAIFIANEFFDALPVRHYVRCESGWHERLVGLADEGQFLFGLAPEADPQISVKGELGAVMELGVLGHALMQAIAARLTAQSGALLCIDYGSDALYHADTLQALRQHRFADPLFDPGEVDLTTHVAFGGLAQSAKMVGAAIYGPVTQGAFLTRLGIFERAARLARTADAAQREAIEQALNRLARPVEASGPGASMAELFKVLAVTSPSFSSPLAGFEVSQ